MARDDGKIAAPFAPDEVHIAVTDPRGGQADLHFTLARRINLNLFDA
jgi:hypothetical protein